MGSQGYAPQAYAQAPAHAPQGYGPNGTERMLTTSLQMIVALLVLLGAYWAACTFADVDDILGLGFGENGAAFNAYLDSIGGKSNLTPKGGRKMALIINVTYRDEQYRYKQADKRDKNGKPSSVALPGCLTDALRMKKFLGKEGFAVIHLSDEICTHVPSGTGITCSSCQSAKDKSGQFGLYPSCANIKSALKTFAKAAKPNDV